MGQHFELSNSYLFGKTPIVISSGVADAGKLVQLDASGKLDSSLLTSTMAGGDVTRIGINFSAVGGAGVAWTSSTGAQWYGGYIRNAGVRSLGNTVDYTAFLGAGTYTFHFTYRRAGTSAIIDCDIVENAINVINNLDTQGGGIADNYQIVTGIIIPTSGIKTIRFTAVGTSGGANDYDIQIQGFAIWRTA